MRNTLATGLGLAALVATGSAWAGHITTDVNRLGVSSDGQLMERPTLAQRLVDATNDLSTGHSHDDDDDHHDHDHDEDAADDDTGGDSKGCGCATSSASGYGALAVLLPLALVGLRRRQD